jgi:hypothetical protein
MDQNPLKKYFRQPALYIRLPTLGRWYDTSVITVEGSSEIPIYGLSAIDDIMLNTPDAMLNGQALENVLKNCVPSIVDVKKLLIPDLDAIFVALKHATNNGKDDHNCKCPSCNHENSFEINCQMLLDSMSYVDDTDTSLQIDDDLMVYLRPYDFEMRHVYMQKEFEEEKMLQSLMRPDLDEFTKAHLAAESVDRLSKITFELVSRSIEKVVMVKENITVTENKFINEWLQSINKIQAEAVITKVSELNKIGVNEKVDVKCQSCGHEWDETLNFDPINFFAKRS